MAGVIWVGEPESLFDVLLYENLQFFNDLSVLILSYEEIKFD